jgi:hypothetical protein
LLIKKNLRLQWSGVCREDEEEERKEKKKKKKKKQKNRQNGVCNFIGGDKLARRLHIAGQSRRDFYFLALVGRRSSESHHIPW